MDSPPPITDATLRKWKAGDREAFLAAVGPWQERLYRILYRVVGNSHDAEEVWQTLMLRLLRRDLPLPAARHFPAWLRRCAVNEAISFVRRQQRLTGPTRQTPAEGALPAGGAEPVEAIADAELRLRLGEELSRLSADQRAMLALRYDEGLTVSQIAVVLQRPRSTVHFQLNQAIELLRRRFAVALHERVGDG